MYLYYFEIPIYFLFYFAPCKLSDSVPRLGMRELIAFLSVEY